MVSHSIKTLLALIFAFNLIIFFPFSQTLSAGAGQQDEKPLAKWLEEARTFCKAQCQPPSSCDYSQCQIAYLSGRAASASSDSSSPNSGPEANGVKEPDSDGGAHQMQKRTALTFQPNWKVKGSSGSKLEGSEYERTKKLCEDVCPECTLEECTDMFVSGMAYGNEHKQEIKQNVPVKVSKSTSSDFTDTADTPNSPLDSKSDAQAESSKPDESYLASFKKDVVNMCANRFPKVDPKVCQGIFIAGMTVTGGAAAVLLAPYALAAAGFSAAGVAAHSFGAFLMSVAAQWGVGGALVAALQSAGAAGVGLLTWLVGGIGGAIAGYFW